MFLEAIGPADSVTGAADDAAAPGPSSLPEDVLGAGPGGSGPYGALMRDSISGLEKRF